METIKVSDVLQLSSKAVISFSVSTGLQKYFNDFSFEYSLPENCLSIPNSILVIPFICNVLPIIWLTDSELIVDEIDQSFYNSIAEFKNGYINMYPQLSFNGIINVKKKVQIKYPKEKNAVLFSGGIDALCTLLRHKEENIDLLTLRGSVDFPLNDIEGWKIQEALINKNALLLSKRNFFVKTNFCGFIKLWEEDLENLIKPVKGSWWHDFQHGIGIISHAAPYAYIYHWGCIYIASSFCELEKKYTCASDPTIDNHIKFGSSLVCHDGYELTRQKKIHFICESLQKMGIKVKLHVCMRQHTQENCCHCEKCYRTICGLIAEGKDPKDFGFNFTSSDIVSMIKYIRRHVYMNSNIQSIWNELKSYYELNADNIKEKKLVRFFENANFNKWNNLFEKRIVRFIENTRMRLLKK